MLRNPDGTCLVYDNSSIHPVQISEPAVEMHYVPLNLIKCSFHKDKPRCIPDL